MTQPRMPKGFELGKPPSGGSSVQRPCTCGICTEHERGTVEWARASLHKANELDAAARSSGLLQKGGKLG